MNNMEYFDYQCLCELQQWFDKYTKGEIDLKELLRLELKSKTESRERVSTRK